VIHSVLGGHLSFARLTVENKLGGFRKCACEDCTSLNWSLQKIVTQSVIGGHLLGARLTVENKLGGFQKCACDDFTLLNWSFAEYRDTLRIRRPFSTRTSNFQETLGGCACEDCTSLNWSFVENRDTLRIRRSFTTHTSDCWEKLSGFQKCACEDFTSLNWLWYLVENRDTLRIGSRVWFTKRASDYREKSPWFLIQFHISLGRWGG